MKTAEPGRRNQRTGIALIAGLRVSRSIAAGMINVAFPYYILSRLHYGAFIIGLIYVSATITTAVLGFTAGIVTDIWGKRGTLMIASALLPVSAILIYFSHSLWLIFPAAMIGGYSATGSLAGGGIGGAVQPIQSTVIASLVPGERRTRIFSLFTFMSGVTAALGALLTKVFDVREIFLIAAIASALGIPGLWKLKVAESKGMIGRLKTKKTIGKFTVTGMLNGFSQGLVVPFLIPFFVLVYHVPKSQMSEYAFASGLLAAFALLGAPVLERHFGFVKSIVLTRGTGMVLLTIFPLVTFLPLSVLIYILVPSLRVAAVPIQQSELTRRVSDDEMGRALGINQVARLAASSTGTGLSGYLMESALFEIPFFAYGLIMATNLYLYFKFFGLKKREEVVDSGNGEEIK